MENNTYAPILLFVYNRPAHTRRLVESLLQNTEAAQSRLFVYSDAALIWRASASTTRKAF